MKTDGKPRCPSCLRPMTYYIESNHNHTKVKSNPDASWWLCDPDTGGCGVKIPRTLGRRR